MLHPPTVRVSLFFVHTVSVQCDFYKQIFRPSSSHKLSTNTLLDPSSIFNFIFLTLYLNTYYEPKYITLNLFNNFPLHKHSAIMTRSHKANDIPHNHPEAEAAFDEHKIPKYFGKTGFVDTAPNKVKKNGGGKGNWGRDGDEFEGFNAFKTRRRSNSMGNIENQFVPSKFEVVDDEPLYDERVHGARNPGVADDGAELASTISNTSSVEGEKA